MPDAFFVITHLSVAAAGFLTAWMVKGHRMKQRVADAEQHVEMLENTRSANRQTVLKAREILAREERNEEIRKRQISINERNRAFLRKIPRFESDQSSCNTSSREEETRI